MTRLLIASLNYAPEETGIAPYSTGLAEHLASRGYRVTVLTGLPHYPAWQVDSRYAGEAQSSELRNGVHVLRSRHYVPAEPTPLHRAFYEGSSLSMALAAARVPRPDAVVGIVPSLSGGIVARAAAMRFGAPYGLVFQDLMGRAATQIDTPGAAAMATGVRLAEAWAARGASGVGIIAEGMRGYVESLGVAPSRIRRLRNWARTAEPTIDRATMRSRLGWPDGVHVCLHAGNMGAKQGLENVIEAAKLAVSGDAPLLFVLMGDGSQRASVEALASKYGLANVQFLPLQHEARYASILHAADVLLLNQRGGVIDMSLPSKLASYFASGRPVVAAAAANSETAREIEASRAGIVAAPDDPGGLFAEILRVVADRGLAEYLCQNGKRWAREELSQDAALRAYEQFVATLLATGKHGRVVAPSRVFAADADNDGDRRAA